jgi:hypothetical protein
MTTDAKPNPFAHIPDPSLFTRMKQVAASGLVGGRVRLLHGIMPCVAVEGSKAEEPLFSLFVEILCDDSLRHVEKAMQEKLGVSPDDLHAALEFVIHLTSLPPEHALATAELVTPAEAP